MKIKKLTEEEIAKLPFPDTARALGGILYFDSGLSQEDVDKLRKQFKESLANSTDVVRTPIIGDEDER